MYGIFGRPLKRAIPTFSANYGGVGPNRGFSLDPNSRKSCPGGSEWAICTGPFFRLIHRLEFFRATGSMYKSKPDFDLYIDPVARKNFFRATGFPAPPDLYNRPGGGDDDSPNPCPARALSTKTG